MPHWGRAEGPCRGDSASGSRLPKRSSSELLTGDGQIRSIKMFILPLIGSFLLMEGPFTFAKGEIQPAVTEADPSPIEEAVISVSPDPDASPSLRFEITPHLSMGAKMQLSLLRRVNRDLDGSEEDDRNRSEATFDLATKIVPRTDIDLFAEARLTDRRLSTDADGEKEHETKVRLRRGYLLWRGALFPSIDLQVGRQRFADPREWIYDENLDAVRVRFNKDLFALEFSVSSNLLDPEEPEDRIRNYVAYATYQPGQKDKLALYWISRSDPTQEDQDPAFLGFSWKGRFFQNQKYWLDIASVSGRDGSVKLRGYGVDLMWTLLFDLWMEPSLTLGYAFGSGDPNPLDDVDGSFRQTGLQDNQGKFNGTVKFKYYGELFDPELSNMRIRTLGFGIIPFKKTSFDFVYHDYSLVYSHPAPNNTLRDVGIKKDPSGESKDLGHEVDLIVGLGISRMVRIEISMAAFMPGRAFPGSDNAYSGEGAVRVLF